MKKLLLIMVLLGPFLVANPQSGIDYYVITGLPAAMTGVDNVPPDSTGAYAFKYDLAYLAVGGPYTIKIKACTNMWGCSDDSLPFVFSRPALSAPAGQRLAK